MTGTAAGFNQVVRIGGRALGAGHPAYVIAEIGSNHDRSLDQAKRLIDAAAEAGADAAKFQSIRFDELYLPERCDAQTRALLERIELPEEWYPALAAHCRARGVHFLSSATYERAVDLLVEHGAPAIKIASAQFDIHPEVVARAAGTGLPLVMSCGFADRAGIERMLGLVRARGNRNVVLLHCVSRYPTPLEDVNLRAIPCHRESFGCLVGFSDHTRGSAAAPAAVALGAVAIEKHITLDRALAGPDHPFAAEPEEFALMVGRIREVEAALGDGRERPLGAEEAAFRARVTPKWVTRVDLKAGERIEAAKLMLRRCEGGIPRDEIGRLEGRLSARDIPARTPLGWGDVR